MRVQCTVFAMFLENAQEISIIELQTCITDKHYIFIQDSYAHDYISSRVEHIWLEQA